MGAIDITNILSFKTKAGVMESTANSSNPGLTVIGHSPRLPPEFYAY
jgi:hypothetical protein